jgi:hypothetical protein
VEEVAVSVADEDVILSKYADNLPWLENGVKVSPNPSTWVCAERCPLSIRHFPQATNSHFTDIYYSFCCT